MLLRNKLILITLAFFIVAVGGLIYAFDFRSSLQQDSFGSNASIAQESLWGKVIDAQLSRLKGVANKIQNMSALIEVAQIHKDDALRDFLTDWGPLIQSANQLGRIEFYNSEGKLFYSSAKSYFPAVTLSENSAKKMLLQDGQHAGGLVIDSERASLIIMPVKVQKEGTNLGLFLLIVDASVSVKELKTLSKAEIFLINRRGRLLVGSDKGNWDQISKSLVLDGSHAYQIVKQDDKFYSATFSSVQGALNPIGHVVSVKEITDSHQAFIRLQWVTYIVMAGFVLIAGAALWAYLRGSLHPLDEAIQSLAALSEGKYSQTMKTGVGKDEVSQIGRAIIKFQRDLQRLDRMKKSRDSRGRRQSVIIRREMSELASTLDESAQSEVMADLIEIEKHLKGNGEEDSSGSELAAMALTLSRLKERIQYQHGELAKTIEDLEEALKSKTAYLALQQELAIGARVQIAMLPDDLPKTNYFHIAGKMQAAKEVGGDFYDFFYLDENRLAIVIADVSGKGVPASLFMAISRSILRLTANMIVSPAQCIATLNDELCANNKEELFVTLLYGVLDLRDQTFTYTNAGHNPAYHLHSGLEAISLTGDIALGVMEKMDYSEHVLQLKEGHGLFFYTDGITEAMNPGNEEFGTDAMERVLNENLNAEVHSLMENMVRAVDNFADGAAQADDITCIAIRIGQKMEA